MFPKLTDAALTAALILTIALIAFATSAINTTVAQAYTLGAADSSTQAAPLAGQLGAHTYRVVMDSTVPLEAYAARIDAYRAYGMKPQLVIDGTGTSVRGRHGKNWQTINYAIHAFNRWPDAYSVSVMNEPNESGISVCQYARTFDRAYRMLKAAGVPRVLFGEWSPNQPIAWNDAVRDRCHAKVVADGWAWHCYDANDRWTGIQYARQIRSYLRKQRHFMHTRKGNPLGMYCTEYGALTRPLVNSAGVAAAALTDDDGARAWSNALRQARRYGVREIVAWGVMEAPSGSRWDSSIVDSDGRPRQAFQVIASQQ